MQVDSIRMLARYACSMLAFGLSLMIGSQPLMAQSWFEPDPLLTADFMPGVVSPASFASGHLDAPLSDWKPTVVEPSCATGWYGWLRRHSRPWTGTLELGLNGAQGNTNNSNLFFGWEGQREYQGGDLSFDFDYFHQKADSAVTMDRAVALGRYEREIGETSVNWFVQGFFEYDDLRAYPARLAVTAGLSKRLIETDRFKFTGRVGAGASKKIDAPDDRWRPELQFGADYEYRLTDRQRLLGFIDYFPDMSSFSTYRLNYKLAWEALLEEDWGLAMRASLMNWYDSDPGPGTKANDLYYVLSLTWGY